ncbi:MAG TPA: Hsp20/alpha crystallin family protein [Vicinamibacterales bacterium]|nr:Hsp20/alpha crystallin family protein [Vicinamibacterales bacterium]
MDVGDLAQEVRRLFEELNRRRPEPRPLVSGECLPLQDVFETEHTIEFVLDVPGVMLDACRVMIKAGVVLVVGEKERAEPVHGPASFHLVERDFGRFARAVRVHAAVDAAKARARLKDGELRIILPKVAERRGREILVTIDADTTPPAG